MTTTIVAPAPLIGHYVPEIHALARRGLLWAVLYGLFARGSSGGCLAPDAAADAVCYTAVLNPSPLVWLAMAVVFVVSLGRTSKATDIVVIRRILSRAATAMWVIPLAVAGLSFWAFFASSPEAWVGGTLPPNVTVRIDAG
ncbi:hypothetical protein [Microbacterium cremeum]|uniref:hypothetical protein n=1 Tax=Microbacterium cremeum TaxID=2782169 RepID=UPI00188911B8|nr:hypothetical protein [Microbacterium cremeum]